MIRDTSVLDLPTLRKEGHPPTRKPRFVTALAEAWFDKAMADRGEGRVPAMPDRAFRGSDISTRCDRAMFYNLIHVTESNPPSIADVWRFSLGDFVHDGLQTYMPNTTPNMRAELVVDLAPIGIDGSAHCDGATMICRLCSNREEIPLDPGGTPAHARMLWTGEEQMVPFTLPNGNVIQRPQRTYACERCSAQTRWLNLNVNEHKLGGEWDRDVERAETVLEIKSANGFKFKLKASSVKGPPEGPDYGHIMQGALAGAGLDADAVVVGYVSLENLGTDFAHLYGTEVARFAAEWNYTMDSLRPYVAREAKRLERLWRYKEANDDAEAKRAEGGVQVRVRLPARELHDPEYPVGAVVTDPKPPKGRAPWRVESGGQLIGLGDTWMCGYCRHQDRCNGDGA